MATEPVQELVKLALEKQGFFVRSNVRFRIETTTKKRDGQDGKSASYSDLDLLAVRFDPKSGRVVDKVWAEAKSHLTLALTLGYLRTYARDYATMLGPAAWTDPVIAKMGQKAIKNMQQRQARAKDCADEVLGKGYRRVLYFGGRKPKDDADAKKLLDVEVEYVRDLAPAWIGAFSAQEGNETVVRVINLLTEYDLLRSGRGE